MAKRRVSLTLDDELVENVDELAESQEMNRSRTIGEILRNRFSSDLKKAIVFCGDSEAKCLDEHKNKTVIQHILDHLVSNGIETVYILAGKNKEEVEEVCGSVHREARIIHVSEDSPKGNAAALRKLEDKISETFVAVNGHVITDVDLEDMHQSHKNNDSTVTMALKSVENPSNYGVARLKGQRVLGFEEKPAKGEEPSKLINAGTYIINPEIFSKLEEDNIEQVFENLAREKELSGYIYGGQWLDISR